MNIIWWEIAFIDLNQSGVRENMSDIIPVYREFTNGKTEISLRSVSFCLPVLKVELAVRVHFEIILQTMHRQRFLRLGRAVFEWQVPLF